MNSEQSQSSNKDSKNVGHRETFSLLTKLILELYPQTDYWIELLSHFNTSTWIFEANSSQNHAGLFTIQLDSPSTTYISFYSWYVRFFLLLKSKSSSLLKPDPVHLGLVLWVLVFYYSIQSYLKRCFSTTSNSVLTMMSLSVSPILDSLIL